MLHQVEFGHFSTAEITKLGGFVTQAKLSADNFRLERQRNNLPAIAIGVLDDQVRR